MYPFFFPLLLRSPEELHRRASGGSFPPSSGTCWSHFLGNLKAKTYQNDKKRSTKKRTTTFRSQSSLFSDFSRNFSGAILGRVRDYLEEVILELFEGHLKGKTNNNLQTNYKNNKSTALPHHTQCCCYVCSFCLWFSA